MARTKQPLRQNAVRLIKKCRNLVVDPLPRKHTLVYEGYRLDYPRIEFIYRARGHLLVHSIACETMGRGEFGMLAEARMVPLLNTVGVLISLFNYTLTDFLSVRSEVPIPRCVVDRFSDFARGCLGEFRFLQGLDPLRPVPLEAAEISENEPVIQMGERKERTLLMNGGGKDTIVAAELLKEAGVEFDWFFFGSSPARNKIVEISGHPCAHRISCSMDPTLGKLGRYPWGTMPFFGRAAAASWIIAAVYGYGSVAAGNEYSSNFGNVIHRGFSVSHQFDKSYDAEVALNEMVHEGSFRELYSYSLLRPFHEILIARLFAEYPEYFDSFVSCNRNQHQGTWCGVCEKCAFIYLILAPFIEDNSTLNRIFGANLIERPIIRGHIIDLTKSAIKPWECVGVPGEAKLALRLLLDRKPDLDFDSAPYRADLLQCCSDVDPEESQRRYLQTLYAPHRVPPNVMAAVHSAIDRR